MADLTCGMKMIKYLLFGFNIVFFIMGFAMALSGGVVLGQLGGGPVAEFLGGALNYAGVFVIIVGIFVMILSFFGCCGAFTENACMVKTYAALMIFLVVIQLIVVITAGALRGQIKKLIEESMDDSMEEYDASTSYMANSTAITSAWDRLQEQFKCCGLNKIADWDDNVAYNGTRDVPDSCCITHDKGCGKGARGQGGIFTEPCLEKIEAWLVANVLVGVGFGLSIFLLQIVGIIFACCLARQIGNYKEV